MRYWISTFLKIHATNKPINDENGSLVYLSEIKIQLNYVGNNWKDLENWNVTKWKSRVILQDTIQLNLVDRTPCMLGEKVPSSTELCGKQSF